MDVALEIAVQDPEGVAAAVAGGADRIELCTALALGGLTPSAGLVRAAVAAGRPVHVLVRPRAGGFEYSAVELAVILDDVRRALDLGAQGVVVGGVRGERIDTALVERVRALAGPAEVTFHRAFDTLTDLEPALDVLAGLGVDRVLTSGGASRVADGLPQLERLVARADGRLEVMAGSGVDASTVRAVVATGVAAVHASAKRTVVEATRVDLGSLAQAGSSAREATDEAAVRALRTALDEVRRTS
ncbi:copper homeostasis protein CutC [Cellulomonas sp. NTE-D12]|uniref:copper homeostasis protein CutC n=1 Tax=Cellulomonas sp. NTE-D12 TaxID=2962632 RepID=UPI00308134DA|nr:copper homeostasis protein CutC [Cellulomonas sp. NTE-D12]